MRAVHRLEEVAVDLARGEFVGEVGAGATFFGEGVEVVPGDDGGVL